MPVPTPTPQMIHAVTKRHRWTSQLLRRQRTVSLFLVVIGTQAILLYTLLLLHTSTVTAQSSVENPCSMEIYAFNELTTCTNSNANAAAAQALLIADGQCRSVLSSASVSPTTDLFSYNLLPGNYRAECINSTAVRFIESGCIAEQCNSTSLLTGATCDRNNDIAASLYSRLVVPEYITYPSFDTSYVCTQAFGTNTTVSFVIFGDCSSPSCTVPTPAPIVPVASPTETPVTTPTTPAPIIQSTTPAPVINTAPTPILIITPPSTTSDAPTEYPNENPTLPPNTVPNVPSPMTTPTPAPLSSPKSSPTTTTTTITPNAMTPSIDDNNNVTTPVTNVDSKSNNSMSTLIAGVASGIAFVAVLLAVLLFYRKRKHHREMNDDDYNHSNNHKNVMMDDGFGGSHNSPNDHRPLNPGGGVGAGSQNHYSSTKDDSTAQQYAATTNEIWVDPNADEVSTLGGGTLPNEFAFGQDEPTASVNMDYDYNRNQYRVPDGEERTQSQFTTASNPTTFTNYSKLGLLGQSDFAADDDHSFEEQFAELDNDIRSTQIYDTPHGSNNNMNNNNNPNISNRVKPFEVRAPPGKLGMVVDTPNGGVPVVRAIKADSVLNGSVQIGDRLISVDHVNVTSMSALEVSNLISLKQHQQRLLIFCRLTPP